MKVILGITGSIAAYKSILLARLLISNGHEVQIVITPAGKEFVTPLTLATLTRRPVVSEFFSQRDGTWNSHVDLGLWADVMIVAPATAATIAKMATGVADNMLITTYMSAKCPVVVAPAMDLDMYAHPATQHNINTLRSYGNHIIEAEEGELASGLVGKGRMAEPHTILKYVERLGETADATYSTSFITNEQTAITGKKVLITAGPTYERIDPVRFIGNYSSGKMGFAIAEECARRGAEVTLIAGPVSIALNNTAIERIDVESAQEMCEETIGRWEDEYDIAILAAAVADFSPAITEEEKIKRGDDDLVLLLKPTTDIASRMGIMKERGQLLIGFALETDDGKQSAMDKMQRKNLDMIVLNTLTDKGAGFRTDTNKITIITEHSANDYPLKPKAEVAEDILNEIEQLIINSEQ